MAHPYGVSGGQEIAIHLVKTNNEISLGDFPGNVRDDRQDVYAFLESDRLCTDDDSGYRSLVEPKSKMSLQFASDRLRDDYDTALFACRCNEDNRAYASDRVQAILPSKVQPYFGMLNGTYKLGLYPPKKGLTRQQRMTKAWDEDRRWAEWREGRGPRPPLPSSE